MSRVFNWDPTSQVLRIFRVNTRAAWIDILYSLLYVIAGFFLSGQHGRVTAHMTGLFVIISCVMGYFTFRLCNPESARGTSIFYSNMPRSRVLAYWANVGWLCLIALFLETLAFLGMHFGLNAKRPDIDMVIAPSFVLLPFVFISCGVWIAYAAQGSWYRLTAAVVYVALVVVGIAYGSISFGSDENLFEWSYAAALGILVPTILLFIHAGYVWSKTQIGEIV